MSGASGGDIYWQNEGLGLVRCLAGFPVSARGGVNGYLAPDMGRCEAGLSEEYPVGSPAVLLEHALERRGFRPGQPFAPDTLHDVWERCLQRGLTYGFWAGGFRHVCYRGEKGKITGMKAFQLIAGL